MILNFFLISVLAFSVQAETYIQDNFNPLANPSKNILSRGKNGDVISTTKVRYGDLETGHSWQNTYQSSQYMSDFIYNFDGENWTATPQYKPAASLSANNYVKNFSNYAVKRKILTTSADFIVGDDVTRGTDQVRWVLGFWRSIQNSELADSKLSSIFLQFMPKPNDLLGKLRLFVCNEVKCLNNLAGKTPNSPSKVFIEGDNVIDLIKLGDVIRLTLSYDINTGEVQASALNLSSHKTSSVYLRAQKGINNLNYAGFGMSSVGLNLGTTGHLTVVDNFKLSADAKSSQLVSDRSFSAGFMVNAANVYNIVAAPLCDPMPVLDPNAITNAPPDPIYYPVEERCFVNPTITYQAPLQETREYGRPIWGLSQWNTFDSILNSSPIKNGSETVWKNNYKSIAIDSSKNAVTLTLDAKNVYKHACEKLYASYNGADKSQKLNDCRNKLPPNGVWNWPHLSIFQAISTYGGERYGLMGSNSATVYGDNSPRLNELTALELSADITLMEESIIAAEDKHLAMFSITVPFQNMNTSNYIFVPASSKDLLQAKKEKYVTKDAGLSYELDDGVTLPKYVKYYDLGKEVSFGMMVYNASSKFINAINNTSVKGREHEVYTASDPTGASMSPLIYQIAFPFLKERGPLKVGVKRHFRGDILPYIKNAFHFLKNKNRNPKLAVADNTVLGDFRISRTGMGFEISNLAKIGIKIENYSLNAVGYNFPKKYNFSSSTDQFDRKGWMQNSSFVSLAAGNSNTWDFRVDNDTGGNPKISSPPLSLNSQRFSKVKVNMGANTLPPASARVELVWDYKQGDSFYGTGSQSLKISNKALADYVFDMTNHRDWRYEITNVRLEFVGFKKNSIISLGSLQFEER